MTHWLLRCGLISFFECPAHRLVRDPVDVAQLHELARQQAQRPAGAALGGRGAGEGEQAGLRRVVEAGRLEPDGMLVLHRALQALLAEAAADPVAGLGAQPELGGGLRVPLPLVGLEPRVGVGDFAGRGLARAHQGAKGLPLPLVEYDGVSHVRSYGKKRRTFLDALLVGCQGSSEGLSIGFADAGTRASGGYGVPMVRGSLRDAGTRVSAATGWRRMNGANPSPD